MPKKIKINKTKMSNKNKSSEGKTIFLLKKEDIFPDWGIFKSVNELYWKFIFKKIKKSENKNIKIIADNEIFTILKNMKINNLVKINDYIPDKYENVYVEALELFKNWFSQKPLNTLTYDGIFIKDIVEQEFCYSAMEPLNNLKIIDYIIKKENPNKIKTINEKYLFGKICKQSCLENNISFNSINKGGILKKLDYLIKKISFFARFKNIPLINRREFVKTQNKNMKNKEFILFGVHDDYYYSRLQNVIDKARLDNLDIKGIITNISTQQKAKKQGLDFFSFGDFFENNQKLKDFKKELIKKEKIFNKYFQKKGLNYGG
ncbi:MAG: hypothetical protein KJ689_13485, partial [Bacteroidetes bacterium]|nr:hypothetical protein [Bacteroidota bacterium]